MGWSSILIAPEAGHDAQAPRDHASVPPADRYVCCLPAAAPAAVPGDLAKRSGAARKTGSAVAEESALPAVFDQVAVHLVRLARPGDRSGRDVRR